MTFTVLVQPSNGQYSATLVGAPEIRAVGPTRAQAVAAVQAEISERIHQGELVTVEVMGSAVTDLAGKYADDPTLREICDAAYRERDAETLP